MAEVRWNGLFLVLIVQAAGAQTKAYYLYDKVGASVNLPCANVIEEYPDCLSTTWNYNRDRNKPAYELVAKGKFKENFGNRLHLEPNCSLTVHNARAEDVGIYTCQQWPSTGGKYGDDETTYLSLLSVSSSTAHDDQLTLNCSLIPFDGTCEEIKLSCWNKGGEESIGNRIDGCRYVLTTPRQEGDPDNMLICRLIGRGEGFQFNHMFTETKVHEEIVPRDQTVVIIAAVTGTLSTAVLVLIVALLISRRRRADKTPTSNDNTADQRPAGHADSPGNQHGSLPGQDEPEPVPDSGVTYASINHSNRKRTAVGGINQDNAADGDTVTYATVKKLQAASEGGNRQPKK